MPLNEDVVNASSWETSNATKGNKDVVQTGKQMKNTAGKLLL